MEDVLKVAAGALVAIILGLALKQHGKELGVLLSIGVCCMILAVGLGYLKPIVAFLENLQALSGMQPESFTILLKTVGIGLVAEIATLICTDAGNAAMGKAIQILSCGVILWLSLPLMNALLELIQTMLEDI